MASLQVRQLPVRRGVGTRALNSNDIKNGLTLVLDDAPWRVMGAPHCVYNEALRFVL